jgi:hypothetical protein
LLREASEFVRGNREELLRLAIDASVEKLGVDFGLIWNSEAAMMSVALPPGLLTWYATCGFLWRSVTTT